MIQDKKVLIFDLDDTLSLSKQPLDNEMADLLKLALENNYIVAVTSGGTFNQFEKQFLSNINVPPILLEKLFLIPTSGASLYSYSAGKWHQTYSHNLTEDEKIQITTLLKQVLVDMDLWNDVSDGEIIEDRGSQITYSGLGQNASIEVKEKWDPNQEKRKKIVHKLEKKLSEFDINIGGKTSIDITKKGINKSLGIMRLSKLLSIPISKMVFIGDALYEGGNDEKARESGIDCVSVTGVEDTKTFIQKLLQTPTN